MGYALGKIIQWLGTIERNVLNWLVIVVDSEKGGRKNGSSLPVLPCG